MVEKKTCDLNGTFSYVVQVFLILLIFAAVKSTFLLKPAKHYFERPKRKLPLFMLDGLKQLLSNGLIHVINIFFSVELGKSSSSDQCGIYFVSVVLDVTLGTLISFTLLYTFDRLVSYQYSKVD